MAQTIKTLAISMVLAIACTGLPGCEEQYNAVLPEGMILVEHHYTDYQELVIACSKGVGGYVHHTEGCAYVEGNVCTIHLGLAWNGDPMHRDHEIRHCSGDIDAPQPIKRYFPE